MIESAGTANKRRAANRSIFVDICFRLYSMRMKNDLKSIEIRFKNKQIENKDPNHRHKLLNLGRRHPHHYHCNLLYLPTPASNWFKSWEPPWTTAPRHSAITSSGGKAGSCSIPPPTNTPHSSKINALTKFISSGRSPKYKRPEMTYLLYSSIAS